jgi:hypothetical protein
MSNIENPSVENPALDAEDEGETELKVRTNLKAGFDASIYAAGLLAPRISKIDPNLTTTYNIKTY